MAKKMLEAETSKLARHQSAPAERPRLVSARKTSYFPKSFRLGALHLERLQRVIQRLSDEAGRPISETELVKGLLLLGEKTETKKLLLVVKDAVFEGG